MSDPLFIYGVGQLSVAVRDLDRAEAFYRDVLGLQPLFRSGLRLSFFDCAGLRLILSLETSNPARGGSSELYFRVTEIEAEFARLAAQGVTILEAPRLAARMPDHELWLGAFEDSEGNRMRLMEEREPD